MEILVKNRNFGQKSKFRSKMEVLFENRNFGKKSNVFSKIEILSTVDIFVNMRRWVPKSKVWPKIYISVKNILFLKVTSLGVLSTR